ncbi:MAG TPA: class I SAM-dependent methyltransferase, partial [Nitrososphaera sp.]|nr:class I SAM-dependent methyltransferase [Nitrososphaera sp.]
RYFGADPSDEAVALARKNLKGRSVTIAKVDGERLPFSDEFDIVYLGESLYASSDKATFLRNCYRSLRRGGTLMILEGLVPENGVEGNDNNDMVILGMQLDFALQGHRFMQKQELMGLVREAGFKKTVLMPLGGSVYLASARK